MSRPLFLAALLAATISVAAPAASNAPAVTTAMAVPAAGIPAPSIAASVHLLVDVTSGQTLASVNGDERRDPASLTKLMTAYLVFGALRAKAIQPSQMVNVSERAWRAEGSRMFIEPRRAVSVDELLHGMIIQSGNDAAIALAELVAGSEEAFVAKMNAETARLGMTNSRFANVTGLTAPDHYSTAADLARLASAVIVDYPEFYPLYAQKEFRYNGITQQNRNRLLWTDPGVDGVKTGHTDAAGWCLIASARNGERRLLAVVLGAASDAARASEAQKLLNWGFQAFDTVRLYQSGKPIGMLTVWKGSMKEVPAGFLADRYLTLPKGKADKLALTMDAQQTLVAPIARAQPVGTVKVSLEGKPVAEFPLIALEEVPEAGILGRAWDTIRLWFKR
jgi:serine-type D-Ala-D-Ala carboxypeptidase (penicillin-binding protein 5/6)